MINSIYCHMYVLIYLINFWKISMTGIWLFAHILFWAKLLQVSLCNNLHHESYSARTSFLGRLRSLLYIIRVMHTELRVDTAGAMKLQARSLPCDVVSRISDRNKETRIRVYYAYSQVYSTSKKSRNHVII